MNTEIAGIIITYVTTVLLAVPLGHYIGKVYNGDKTWLDKIFNPLDKIFFKFSGIKPEREMSWKQHLVALLTINLLWFLFSMLVLMNMRWLPLNPDGNPSMTADLAFNTTISFVSNTNLQHYSGETGVSYLGQMVLMLFQFISAGAGMAVCAVVFNAMKERTTEKLGNFYNYFIKSCTRILLPLSIVVAVILLFNGTPMNFEGKGQYISLQGDTVNVSRGAAAAMVAIKQLGTNGGGFFGANAAHPLENPNYFTNIIENICILLIPIAMIFALGYIIKRKRFAWMVFAVMTLGFLLLLLPSIYNEMHGNPEIAKMGIPQPLGSMEGKEVRFGGAASAYWGISTTCTSNGSVNAMHDSFTPLTGMSAMLGMMVNSFYGGVGVGFLNFYIFIIIAVFISGLMVGRTPELLGKKIEAKEMKIASIIALLHTLLILAFTALSSYMYAHDPTTYAGWLSNPGNHGFSEMLYEFTSSSANNGSGFEGLGDGVPFWNITCGIVMLLGRFLPIIGPVAIAGILAKKKYIPESAGTLKTDTSTFGIMIFAVIFIVAALSFFPALSLGPIAEYFTLHP
ncbi:potassium-transporting ATPase subunit KdpA [Panacibacter ginsenosidivorans]|uniref:Potassium-transporting ATPase potassium-binding subunit n=1 Tax=Panacibacter ginsenosidivorans TaxID=1813871 RepID=A0A5B8V4L1_9BACT|nr:potassium-transporting ATPase subunit KdpA [Panacibacter ginsenosidivorans]QEC66324.1 potassium-transporting ATPase subunit KdpA [Panacibacter ginsenosidivorans]